MLILLLNINALLKSKWLISIKTVMLLVHFFFSKNLLLVLRYVETV